MGDMGTISIWNVSSRWLVECKYADVTPTAMSKFGMIDGTDNGIQWYTADNS